MLLICMTLIRMILMYCLVNQTILELLVVQLIGKIFHCACPSIFDIELFLRSNLTE